MPRLVGLYKDKAEYMLVEQREKIEFKRKQAYSQYLSAKKREKNLRDDIFIYLAFFLLPIIVMLISFFITFGGNLALRLVSVPLLIVSSAIFIFLCPISAYKLSVSFIMYLFNRHAGKIFLFGKPYSLYTYKEEADYCLAKVQRLDQYIDQIKEWDYAHEEGKDIPDLDSIQIFFDGLDLDVEVKVALMQDPIVKRLGIFCIPLLYISIGLMVALIWGGNILAISKAYEALGNIE